MIKAGCGGLVKVQFYRDSKEHKYSYGHLIRSARLVCWRVVGLKGLRTGFRLDNIGDLWLKLCFMLASYPCSLCT